jgi:membrane protease YdiL (CAAX protease family)
VIETERSWPWWAVFPIAIGAVVVSGLVYLIVSVLRHSGAVVHQAGSVGVALHGVPPVLTFTGTVAQDLFAAGAAVYLAIAALHSRARGLAALGFRGPRRWPSSLGFVLIGYVVFIVVSALWTTGLGLKDHESVPIELGSRDSALAAAGALILTCVVAPICEETLFRGYLYGALRRHGVVLAALVTGILFGGVHIVSAPVGFLVPLGFLGVILCVIYERTGSLYPSMALHALNNSIAFGVGDGRAWLIPVGIAAAWAAIAGLSRFGPVLATP